MTFRNPLSAVVGTMLAFGLPGVISTNAIAAEPWAKKVAASYRIEVSGIKFGLFNFSSTRNGRQYTIQSNAKLRAFFGAFKWRGSASSTGQITPSGPMPASYSYSARKKKKRPKSVSMNLVNRNVTALTVNPPPNPSKRRVPLHANDKKDVLDPMSAIIALTVPAGDSDPCRQSVRIFDGKHRFDIRLTPKGRRAVKVRQGKGFARRAHVCRVRYVPIAGHKTGKSDIVDFKGIEVWLVPAANHAMYMPYRIVVPTVIGNAVLQVKSISVELSNNDRIALVN